MLANPWRGEVDLVLDGKTYILRPSFEALCRIECELQVGIIALARKLAAGALTLEEATSIVFYAASDSLKRDALGETLMRNGLNHAIEALGQMFAMILGGFHEPQE